MRYRNELRATFDEEALLYDRIRPGYPEALFDDVVSLSGIPPRGRILEIGPGTGQATLPFARRGYRVLAIELGENLAAVARRNLTAFSGVEVRTGAFEEWPVEEGAFDLAISATAFHWIDPTVAYPKTAQALRPGGAIALFWNLHVRGEACQEFFETVQKVYEREAPDLIPVDYRPLSHPDEVPEPVKEEIARTGLFGAVTVRKYPWAMDYDARSYLDVLNTYSGHRRLPPARREALLRGIAELIDSRYGGRITKSYLAILYAARRK